eukprot:6198755-Amphidinium_carterae.2
MRCKGYACLQKRASATRPPLGLPGVLLAGVKAKWHPRALDLAKYCALATFSLEKKGFLDSNNVMSKSDRAGHPGRHIAGVAKSAFHRSRRGHIDGADSDPRNN